jgi:hypothetical protein
VTPNKRAFVDAWPRTHYGPHGVCHSLQMWIKIKTSRRSQTGRRPSLFGGRSDTAGAIRGTWIVALGLLATAGTGCSVRTSTFEIVDYREPGEAKRYRETFDEAYYTLDEHGNVDIVLRRLSPRETEPGQGITQVIHIRSVWRSIPGDTVAHRTQINATVSYHILSGRVGATFEGAGSVFFTDNRRTDRLVGTLDLATLRPKRRLVAGSPLFRRAELAGEFCAARNPRRVVRIINEMNRRFGPLPPH